MYLALARVQERSAGDKKMKNMADMDMFLDQMTLVSTPESSAGSSCYTSCTATNDLVSRATHFIPEEQSAETVHSISVRTSEGKFGIKCDVSNVVEAVAAHAATSGVQVGDIIVKLDGNIVKGHVSQSLVSKAASGGVELEVIRRGCSSPALWAGRFASSASAPSSSFA